MQNKLLKWFVKNFWPKPHAGFTSETTHGDEIITRVISDTKRGLIWDGWMDINRESDIGRIRVIAYRCYWIDLDLTVEKQCRGFYPNSKNDLYKIYINDNGTGTRTEFTCSDRMACKLYMTIHALIKKMVYNTTDGIHYFLDR